MGQLNTLILILQDILAGIISNHFDQVKSDTQAKAEGKIAASALDKAKAQLEDLKAALSAEKSSPADQAKIEQAEKDLLASLNTVIAAVQTMTAAVAPSDVGSDAAALAWAAALFVAPLGAAAPPTGQPADLSAPTPRPPP